MGIRFWGRGGQAVEALKTQYEEEADKRTANMLFVYIIKVKYYKHDSDHAHAAARDDGELATLPPLQSTGKWRQVLSAGRFLSVR